jgi:pimeloyl-ACP methyl ester carboxylesterase
MDYCNSALIVGNSWGGGWALYFAAKNPERVDTLFLIEASGLVNPNGLDKSTWTCLFSPIANYVLAFVTKKTVEEDYREKLYYDQSKLEASAADEVFNALKLRNNLYAQKKNPRNLDWAKTDRELSTLKNVVII